MSRFEVWAPLAGRVELVTRDDHFPMRRGDAGWWRREHPHEGELDYAFSLDGDQPLADPRSRWLPAPNNLSNTKRGLCSGDSG